MKPHTLLQRFVMTVIVIELVCAGGFSGLALLHEWHSRLRAVDATLQGRSDSLLGAVQDAEDPTASVVVDPQELPLPENDFYAVYNRGGQLLDGSRAVAELTSRAGDGLRTLRFHRQLYRVWEREALRIIDRKEHGGVGLLRPVTIVYAVPISRLLHETLEAAGFYAVVSIVLAGSTALLLTAAIRKLLRPIQELATAAVEITATDLAFDPPRAALELEELRPLALGLSGAMARLQDAFAQEHRFVGDAAHELKTAVAVVRSSIQVLHLRPRTPEEYRQGLDLVLADNERVENLVARMLLLARFEENFSFREATDLTATVEETIRATATYAELRKVHIEAALTQQACAHIHPDAATTLVSNLIVNAVQHSPEDAAIAVRVSQGSETLLEIRDQGEGIDAKDLPHIFERFYRTDASRSRNTGGAGLGLAICKGIVESAGGRITLESVKGEGTTVRVALPTARAELSIPVA